MNARSKRAADGLERARAVVAQVYGLLGSEDYQQYQGFSRMRGGNGKKITIRATLHGLVEVTTGEWPYDSIETVEPQDLMLKIVSIMEMNQ